MKTTTLKIPTMNCQSDIRTVSDALVKLDIVDLSISNGEVDILSSEFIQKVEFIKAIEEAGFFVIY